MNAEIQTCSKGELYEGIAFTFCKASTLALFALLITGPEFIFSVIALGTSFWYIIAMLYGKNDTRCVGRKPIIIIIFWVLLGGIAAWWAWSGKEFPSIIN